MNGPRHLREQARGVADYEGVDLPDRTLRPWRFWPKVEKTETCWLWTGKLNHERYGIYGKSTAHRAAYRIVVGPIPDGLHLDHLCRVRHCVNPAHLEPVTPAENCARAKRDSCRNGHPYVEGSYYLTKSGTRKCRTCLAAAKRRHRNTTTRRTGHRLAMVGPGDWRCACGQMLGHSQSSARERLREHRGEMWQSDRRPGYRSEWRP